MVLYQWWVFAVLLSMWTAVFYWNAGSLKRVAFDRLWWMGVLMLGMVIGGLSYADRDMTQLSPYAMLNEGGERMVGQMSVDDMLGIKTGIHDAPKQPSAAQKAGGVDHDLFELLQTQRFNRNDPCPCKSGKKFKACCFATQQNLKSSSHITPDIY